MKVSWKSLFNDFRKTYPRIWRRGTTYKPYGFMTILISVPGLGKFTYEYYHKNLDLIEAYESEEEKRANKIEERERKLCQFKEDIPRMMKEKHLTQSELSELCGVSRESINKYLSGKKIPKVDTMDKIYKGIDKR